MDLDLWIPSHGLGSSAGRGWGWQCDFHFGYVPDVIEEEAVNEKCCVQVLKCLIAKADAEIFKLEDDLAILQSQFKWAENEHGKLYELWCAVFREKICSLNSSLKRLKNGNIQGRHALDAESGPCHEPIGRICEIVTSLLNYDFAVESEQAEVLSVARKLVISDPPSTGAKHEEQSSASPAADSSPGCEEEKIVKVQLGYNPSEIDLESKELTSSGASTSLNISLKPEAEEKEKFEGQDKRKTSVVNGLSSDTERSLTTCTSRWKEMSLHDVSMVIKDEPVVLMATVERRNRFSKSLSDCGKNEDAPDFSMVLGSNKSCRLVPSQEGKIRAKRSNSSLLEQLSTIPIFEGHTVKHETRTALKPLEPQLTSILDAELAFGDDQPIASLIQNPQMLKRKFLFNPAKAEIDSHNLVVNGRESTYNAKDCTSLSNPPVSEARNKKIGGIRTKSSGKNRSRHTGGNLDVESRNARAVKSKLVCSVEIQDSALGSAFADHVKNRDNGVVEKDKLMSSRYEEDGMGLPLPSVEADELLGKTMPELKAIAKSCKMRKYSSLSKSSLVEAIIEHSGRV